MRSENIAFFNITKFWKIRNFLHAKFIEFKITYCAVDQYIVLRVIIVKSFEKFDMYLQYVSVQIWMIQTDIKFFPQLSLWSS